MLAYLVLALAAGASGLLGGRAISGESAFERDPFFGTSAATPIPPEAAFADPTPVHIDFPCAASFARGLHAGRWDTWNDLTGMGAPLGVEQCGVYFPLKLIYYLAPSPFTYDVYRVLRLAIVAFGAFLLARARALPVGPAFVTGALIEMSGAFAAPMAFGNASASYMLPWLLLAQNRLIHAPGPAAAAGAAVTIGVTGFSGHPTFILCAWVTFAITWMADATLLWRQWQKLVRSLAWTFLGGLLGLALAAPWLLPFLELADLGASYKYTHQALEVRNWFLGQSRDATPAALLAPSTILFGPTIPALTSVLPWVLGPVIGTITLALGLSGAMVGGLKRAQVAMLVFGLALTLEPPGMRWLYDAPAVRHILPWYAWPLVALPLALSAGEAVQAIKEQRKPWRMLLGPALVVLATIAVTIWMPYDRAAMLRPIDWMSRNASLLRKGFAAHAILVIVVAGLTAWLWRARPRAAAALVSTLALTELAMLVWPYPRPQRSPIPSKIPPIVAHIVAEQATSHGRMVALRDVAVPNTPTLYGIADARMVSAMSVRRVRAYFNLIQVSTTNYFDVNRPGSPLLDAAAVTSWVAPKSRWKSAAPSLTPSFRLAFTGPTAAVYQNDGVIPRARIVHEATFVNGETAAITALATLARDGRDALLTRVILEARPDAVPLPSGPPSSDEQVTIVSSDDPDEMVLRASLQRDGLVVLADTFYPGWNARVDGQEQPIWPANLAFRAVAVPAGEHTIVFRYQPNSLRVGIALAIGASIACVMLLGWNRQRRQI